MYPHSHIISGIAFFVLFSKSVIGVLNNMPEAGTWFGQSMVILSVLIMDLNMRGVFDNVKISR